MGLIFGKTVNEILDMISSLIAYSVYSCTFSAFFSSAWIPCSWFSRSLHCLRSNLVTAQEESPAYFVCDPHVNINFRGAIKNEIMSKPSTIDFVEKQGISLKFIFHFQIKNVNFNSKHVNKLIKCNCLWGFYLRKRLFFSHNCLNFFTKKDCLFVWPSLCKTKEQGLNFEFLNQFFKHLNHWMISICLKCHYEVLETSLTYSKVPSQARILLKIGFLHHSNRK